MSSKRLDTLLRVKVPELDRHVVRSREDSPRRRVNADVVHPVGVPAQRKGLLVLKTENFDRLVDGARCQSAAVKVDGQNAFGVTLQGAETLARLPVPDLDRLVKASADQFGVVKLKGSDSRCVTAEGSNDLAGLNVPDLDGGVVGARGQNVVVELEASDAILVALEGSDCASTRLPVEAHFEAIAVYVFPWSELALGVKM